MKSNRLTLLVVVMIILGVARFAWSPATKRYDKAEAVNKRMVTSSPPPIAVAASSQPDDLGLREQAPLDNDEPGNAFSVRSTPPPVTTPTIAPVVAASPSLAPVPAAAPTPPPPPFQVIGTYDDGGPPAVFIATSSGTLIARPGMILLAEYRVTGITRSQVALLQTSTQRAIELPVPGGVR